MRQPDNALAARLRTLRRCADLTGGAAAARSGVSQSMISRMETGTAKPTDAQIQALCDAYGVTDEERRELTAMAAELREDRTPVHVQLERGGAWAEEWVGRLERDARQMLVFSPTIVPALAQTREYATALLGDHLPPADVEAALVARAARQKLLGGRARRELRLVLTEGALWWHVGGPQVMAAQLERLVELSRLRGVEVGVIPWTAPVNLPAGHAFSIFDSECVLVGTAGENALLRARQEVAEHEARWADLLRHVDQGDEARATLERIAAEYRART